MTTQTRSAMAHAGAPLLLAFASAFLPLAAQTSTGLEVGALPAINFDADEGFGYGALAELYQYGDGTLGPYVWSARPTVFLTTEGRRDFTLFFDAPHVLPKGWRLDVFLGIEEQIATPYYGLGNATVYDELRDLEDGPNPFYYRFGRNRSSATFNVQRNIGDTNLRGLFGAGFVNNDITSVPEEDGSTLFETQFGSSDETEWANFVRAGLVYDTRDRETGTRSGTWTEVLLQRVDEHFGADASYTRWTFTDRRYFGLGSRLVFAHRYLLQGVTAGAPAYDLFSVPTSFRSQEGLGGSKSVRGILKNRFVGRGMLIWNAELRLRAADFSLVGKQFHVILSAFVDQGRVWDGDVKFDELLADLHRGFGGGVRFGMGENFVVAVDMGRSDEAGMPMYIGLGYLY
ncbi:MAG: BamA/TamA family outer membrane protein [Gemmatimonadetes bacterium]|nr:BamA/TamA family outer membrane protein [Gemmatimonadota bacterium]